MIITAKVFPNAKISKVEEQTNAPYQFKIRVNVPAVDGKANAAVIKILAKFFCVKERDVEILSGALNSYKTIRINKLEGQ